MTDSELGLARITFPGYTYPQLMKIIQSRLEDVPGNIVDPDAIQFASRKVAAVSGDARRVLDICRRAVEIAEAENVIQDTQSMTPSKRGRDTEPRPSRSGKGSGMVTIGTIKQAIGEATSTPLQLCLKTLPLSSKLFLAAFLARIRRSGLVEGVLGDIIEEANRLGKMADEATIGKFLLTEKIIAVDDSLTQAVHHKTRTLSQLAPRVNAMGIAGLELMEAGIIGMETRKGERTGKVRLNVGEDEIKLALREDDEIRGLGFSS